MGKGFSKMKKQAKLLQDQFQQMQNQLDQVECLGQAGNGLVKITLSGTKKMKKIDIHPDCVDPSDIEGLQDLIVAAYNDAVLKVDQEDKTDSLPFSF